MKQLEVQIMGQSYLLGCPVGGEATLLDAVERVDSAMCKIRDAGKVKARDRIAVLAALNLAFESSERESGKPLAAPGTAAANGNLRVEHDASGDARLLALAQRLDTALGEDGRLI